MRCHTVAARHRSALLCVALLCFSWLCVCLPPQKTYWGQRHRGSLSSDSLPSGEIELPGLGDSDSDSAEKKEEKEEEVRACVRHDRRLAVGFPFTSTPALLSSCVPYLCACRSKLSS